jgi:hypothetical protein
VDEKVFVSENIPLPDLSPEGIKMNTRHTGKNINRRRCSNGIRSSFYFREAGYQSLGLTMKDSNGPVGTGRKMNAKIRTELPAI